MASQSRYPQLPSTSRITPTSPAPPVSTPSTPVVHSRTRSEYRTNQVVPLSTLSPASSSHSSVSARRSPSPRRPKISTTEWHNGYDARSTSAISSSLPSSPSYSSSNEKPLLPINSPQSSPAPSWPIDEKVDPSRPYPGSSSNRSGLVTHPLRNGAYQGQIPYAHRPQSSTSHARYYPNSTSQPLIPHQRHYGLRTRPPVCIQFRAWLPMCAWFATTIGFFLAIAFWRTEVFEGLDDLSSYLKEEGYSGQAILFFLVFLTTFPPLPLYSTLIVLAGYTYGSITGFVISYLASIVGAFVVFMLFRHCVPPSVASSLLPPSLKRVVRAIEERPSIFFLIRVAPYPYNVLNAVLGSSSSMNLSRYLLTTAASLCKIFVHTTIGSEIRSFKDYHTVQPSLPEDNANGDAEEWSWGRIWTVFGIILCIGLFIYLSIVARRAVDEVDEAVLPSMSYADSNSNSNGGALSGLPHLASPNPFHQNATAPMTFPPSRGPFSLAPPSPSPLPSSSIEFDLIGNGVNATVVPSQSSPSSPRTKSKATHAAYASRGYVGSNSDSSSL